MPVGQSSDGSNIILFGLGDIAMAPMVVDLDDVEVGMLRLSNGPEGEIGRIPDNPEEFKNFLCLAFGNVESLDVLLLKLGDVRKKMVFEEDKSSRGE